MNDKIGSVHFEIRATRDQLARDLRQAEKDLKETVSRTERIYERGAQEAARSWGVAQGRMVTDTRRAEGEIRSSADGIRSALTSMAPALAAAFSAAAVLKYADAWTAGRNALAAAGVATADLAGRQSELIDLANETRSGAAETIALYQRLSIATAELGVSQQDTLRLTELLNKSFQSGGLSAQEAASAALQLSQALASGALQGDELRSLRESAPLLAKAIADAMGVSVGALKDLGAQGKITSQVIVSALLGAGAEIDATFAKTSSTVSQALTVLDNQLGRFVGQTDASLGATDRMADAIILLAENLDVVATAAGIVVTVVGTKAVVAFGAATVSSLRYQATLLSMAAAQTGVSRSALLASASLSTLRTAALFFVTNPIGIAITAVAGALALLAMNGDKASKAAEALAAQERRTGDALREYEEAAIAAATATGEAKKEAEELVKVKRELAIRELESARAARETALAYAEQRAESAKLAATEAMRAGPRDPGEVGGAFGYAGALEEQATAAASAAEAASEAARKAQADYDALEARIRSGTLLGGAGGVGSTTGSRTAARGNEAARETLELERDILAARASGDQAAIDAAEERLLLARTTEKYVRAGYQDAQGAALQEIGWLNEIEALDERRAATAKLLGEYRDADARKAQQITAQARRENGQLRERLSFEAEIARLRGDDGLLRQKERELWIEERINALLEDRPDLTRDAARAVATRESDELDSAATYGRQRDMFSRAFADGIKAALEGDVRSFLTDMMQTLADEALRRAGEQIFDLMFGGSQAAAEGTAQGSAHAAVVGPAIVTAGTTAGAAMASAIVAAGGVAGAAMAAAIGAASAAKGAANSAGGGVDASAFLAFLRNIPGFSAGTSSAPGGLAYVHKDELLVNLPKGSQVIPAHAVRALGRIGGDIAGLTAMPPLGALAPAHAPGMAASHRQRVSVDIHADQEWIKATVREEAGPLVAQGSAAAARYAKADTLGALEKRSSTRRGGSGW